MRGLQFRYAWLVLAILIFVGAGILVAREVRPDAAGRHDRSRSMQCWNADWDIAEATSDKVREMRHAYAAGGNRIGGGQNRRHAAGDVQVVVGPHLATSELPIWLRIAITPPGHRDPGGIAGAYREPPEHRHAHV